jgi:hypothetical protein
MSYTPWVPFHQLNLLIVSFIDYQANALPLYPITPIEAALLPLGMISNSSCALLPFIDWILKSESVMEDRIGVVRTIHVYHRERLGVSQERWDYCFILIGLDRELPPNTVQ